MAQDSDRRPLEEIPADYRCPEFGCDAGPFKSELAFRGHMSGKHKIKYEKRTKGQDAKKLAALKKLDAREFPTVESLEPWMKLAIAQITLFGLPMATVLKRLRDGRGKATLMQAKNSPGGLAYAEQIREQAADPKIIVGSLVADNMLNVWAGWQIGFQLAVEAGDYKAINTMAKDVGLRPLLAEMQDAGDKSPTNVVINLGANDFSSPVVESEFEIIDTAYDLDDDDLI